MNLLTLTKDVMGQLKEKGVARMEDRKMEWSIWRETGAFWGHESPSASLQEAIQKIANQKGILERSVKVRMIDPGFYKVDTIVRQRSVVFYVKHKSKLKPEELVTVEIQKGKDRVLKVEGRVLEEGESPFVNVSKIRYEGENA